MALTQSRIAGTLEVTINGSIVRWVGNLECSLGTDLKTAMQSTSGTDGFKGEPQVPYIKGTIRHMPNLDTRALLELEDATVTVRFANGKGFVLRNAWQSAVGVITTEEALVEIEFQGKSADEF